ncbi:MAG: hypothetical protein VKO01_02420 [Cyanobacteriota bacterium]|nr:hypothetical protein [Cyanobacteriota bacterium]
MTDYSAETLQAIVRAPMSTGLAVAMVDLGLVSTAIEAAAMAREIAGAAEKYPTNSIIQAAFAPEVMKSGQINLEKPDIKPTEVESGAVVDRAIADIEVALQVLGTTAAPADITAYKQFIYDCGKAVAEAAGSGLFGAGNKVSEKEAAALARIKLALGL